MKLLQIAGRDFRLAAVCYWLLPMLLCSILGFAQNIPEPPPNPINFLLQSLRREAQTNLRGEVRELQVFPPRQVPEQIRPEMPAPPPLLPAQLRKNYLVTAELGESIAGRQTWRIQLQPKNNNAASYTIWIDQKWLLRLGTQERDPNGEVVYSARFIRLNTPNLRQQPRQLNLLEPSPKLQRFVETQTGLLLPEGFLVFEIRPRTVGKNNLAALEVRASNGMGVLVLVFTSIGTANTPRIVSRKVGRAFVWVIGNLRRAELERSAASIVGNLNLDALLSSFGALR
ncbi:MAG: sigma-E factor regulatory protein RseB domain-containing protein [Deinococcales bacterium]